ncbi:MAG: rhombosortase, partial [Myxococcota bacterium]
SVDLGFWLLVPGLTWYVGLSGVLHGLLIAGLICGWRQAPGESGALGVVVAAKLAWEQFGGALPGSALTAGGPVIVDAHLFGAAGGLVAGAILAVMTLRRGSI